MYNIIIVHVCVCVPVYSCRCIWPLLQDGEVSEYGYPPHAHWVGTASHYTQETGNQCYLDNREWAQ